MHEGKRSRYSLGHVQLGSFRRLLVITTDKFILVYCLINVFTNKESCGILNAPCPAHLPPLFA
jgi:hypothetical protein